jgi:Uma2 family endonuclease
MNLIPKHPNPSWSIEQLRRHFGMIPAERIRFDPPPGTATEKDVTYMDEHCNRLCELVDGVLVEKAMGALESILAAELIFAIKLYLREHNLGEVLAPDGFLRLSPGLVRAPDVSFISWDRMPDETFPDASIVALVPDLAVEVISKSNTKKEMDRKLSEYFANGARLVWFVYPKTSTVDVYSSPKRKRRLTTKQPLDGGNVLPGLKIPLAPLFAPRRKPKGR